MYFQQIQTSQQNQVGYQPKGSVEVAAESKQKVEEQKSQGGYVQGNVGASQVCNQLGFNKLSREFFRQPKIIFYYSRTKSITNLKGPSK